MKHLSEDEQIAALLGAPAPEIERHLDSCAVCSSAVEEMRREFKELRHDATRWAQREEFFWRRQQLEIRRRLQAERPQGIPLRWAAAAAVLVMAAAILVGSGYRQPTSMASTAPADTDYQLLVAVEQNLARPVPAALEPANVLASDMDSAWRARVSGTKQKSNLSDNTDRR